MKFKNLIRNKKFQISVLVIAILTLTFFLGGKNEVEPLDYSEIYYDESMMEEESLDKEEAEKNNEQENKDKDEKKEDQEKEGLEEKQINNEEQAKQEKMIEDTSKKQGQDKEELVKNQKAEKKEIIVQDNKDSGKKDEYKTDPIPQGKPEPKEWQQAKVDKEKKMTVTLSISARSILNNMDMFNKNKIEVLPSDGVIYQTQKVEFYEGESVFDVLLRETRKNKIHMEFNMTPIYNSNYVEGINNIYEFDCGELSGWMYKVNGWFPSYGASRYELKDGDKIVWEYTCDLGRDIGGEKSAGRN